MEVNMSTQRAHAQRTIHVSEHRGLLMLLSLAVLASVIVTIVAILAITRPATTVLTPSNANAAEQARLEYRRGEWMAGSAASAAAVERARLSYRRGEWNPERDLATAAEEARLEYRRGEWTGQ
jgi:hypothetical protein